MLPAPLLTDQSGMQRRGGGRIGISGRKVGPNAKFNHCIVKTMLPKSSHSHWKKNTNVPLNQQKRWNKLHSVIESKITLHFFCAVNKRQWILKTWPHQFVKHELSYLLQFQRSQSMVSVTMYRKLINWTSRTLFSTVASQ